MFHLAVVNCGVLASAGAGTGTGAGAGADAGTSADTFPGQF